MLELDLDHVENLHWVQDTGYSIRVLAFDNYAGGDEIDEAWIVEMDGEYAHKVIFDEIESGYRQPGTGAVTQDLLADFDSEHFDIGSPEFDALVEEVERGEWIAELEWLEANRPQ